MLQGKALTNIRRKNRTHPRGGLRSSVRGVWSHVKNGFQKNKKASEKNKGAAI